MQPAKRSSATRLLFLAAALALSVLVAAPATLHAAEKSELPSLQERQKRLIEGVPESSNEDLAFPEPPAALAGDLDQETMEDYRRALQGYYRYRMQGYDHRLRLFEWQLLSSKIIFVVVVLLVFSGIYFAAVQFHTGLSAAKRSEGDEPTEFVVTLRGLRVRSPVLGVVILAISLAFFYLYLVFIYPIETVF